MMWFSTFREHILFALSGHVLFAKICSMLAPQYRSLVCMVYGLLAVWTSMGWTYVSLMLGCGFTIMRCMSFALENCERKDGNYNILELLKYNFYLPFFYFGPIMTFDKFYEQ
ncbi:hypothetical protein XENOCAPTIV_022390, partial [Xenoophorus captivus]